jgi:hypothetical protein
LQLLVSYSGWLYILTSLYKVFSLGLISVALVGLCSAALDQRAQSWKVSRALGAAQLAISDIDFIVLPESTGESLTASICDFQDLMQARFGQRPELVTEGNPKYALRFMRVADGGIGGEFLIRRERTRVVLMGGDETAWCAALYAIMQDMLGARWYWAGDLGFEFVSPLIHDFPNHLWRETPAFLQRQLYPVNTDFARRNRLNRVFSFNHNLARVFSPELFEVKPEVFAEVNGRRKVPRGSGGTDPQPDFTNADAVDIAAEAALRFFEENPESSSFSLSINDNVLFDTGLKTESVVSPLRYFRGRPDYTNLVFGFMNRVAERVFDEGEAWQTASGQDRYLTALAYYWTEPAPSIEIHPRVMPVLTSDRAQWRDPDYREEDKALISAWVASGAERVATWDYYFGTPYLYPRQFNQWIAESLRFMSDAGVDVFFSQLPSFWGLDGAKAWFAAELLWDPEQDADALLTEYYENFFGPAAGPIRAFYERAERYRNEHEGQADWIKLYKDEAGIALFSPEVLKDMRADLDAAQRGLELGGVAVDSRFQQRVAVVSDAFRLTELYARYDASRRALYIACFDLEPVDVISARMAEYERAKAAYWSYFERYVDDSQAAPGRRRLELKQSTPLRLARGLLEPAAGCFVSMVQDASLRHRGQELRNFLGPELPRLSGWNLDYRANEFLAVDSSQASSAGDSGLRISGADIFSVFRTFPVVSNMNYELRLRGSWRVSLDNRVEVQVVWLDRNGKTIDSEVSLRLPIERRDDAVMIHLPYTAPNNAYDLRVRIVVSRQYPGDFLDLSELDFGQLR